MRIPHGLRSALASQTSATPSTPTTDEYFGDVSLLLYGDGTNGSTAIVDSSTNNHAITVNGDAQISTAQSKFGGSSMKFDGTGDYLTLPSDSSLDISTGAYTVELWIYFESAPSTNIILGFAGTSTTGNAQLLYSSSNLVWQTRGTGTYQTAYSWTPSTSTWYHLAVSWNGTNNLRMFIDGQLVATNTVSPAINQNGLNIGGASDGYGTHGYIDDLRITKGVARYTSNFTPPTASFSTVAPGEKYFYQNSLLLSADGSNGSTSIVDSSANAHTITVNGDAQISTTQSKFGGASMKFDGNDSIEVPSSTDLSFGSGDFTIECWAYFNSLPSLLTVANFDGGGSYSSIFFAHLPTLNCYISGNGTSWNVLAGNSLGTPSTGVWHHLALVREGNVYRGFLDGVLGFSVTNSSGPYGSSALARIGAANADGTGGFDGYIDDFRITKGVARYTANFTPFTAGFSTLTPVEPYFHNNSLLLHGDGTNGSTTFKDDSINNHTITPYGNAQISTTQSKFGGSSMYFDGAGDYLTAPASDDFSFPGDFTVEFWIKTSTYSHDVSYRRVISNGPNSVNSFQLTFFDGSGATQKLCLYQSGVSVTITGTIDVADGSWHHIALTRGGSSMRLFVDGVQSGSTATVSTSLSSGATYGLIVGRYQSGNGHFEGYLDDLRITKGVARYTANFTPPTSAFPDL